jgi:hypothetical protein
MGGIKQWFADNVDQKQMVTLLVTSIVLGGAVYGLKSTGFGKVATVVKGG